MPGISRPVAAEICERLTAFVYKTFKHYSGYLCISLLNLLDNIEKGDSLFFMVLLRISMTAIYYYTCWNASFFKQYLGKFQKKFLTEHLTNREVILRSEFPKFSGKHVKPYNVEIKSKYGEKIWLDIHETPILDSAGNVMKYHGLAIDNTARKSQENQLYVFPKKRWCPHRNHPFQNIGQTPEFRHQIH